MRLLLSETVQLGQFNEVPPYAILSHTWGDEAEEVIFQDILSSNNSSTTTAKPGYQKVRNTCIRAAADGLEHVWIDSCCIDKTSSAELSEALNSMYYWYQQAEVCYVYLVDVPSGSDDTAFAGSKWFTRGWTLQELIAPSDMIFLDRDWQEIGTKWDLRELISEITGVPVNILLGDDPGLASIAQRMSWAANRVTKKVEDRAYSLMGLFGVNMPLLYGERERAFLRLQEEIMKGSNDHSIFAWTTAEDHGGPLATTPAAFANSGDIVPVDPSNTIGNYPVVSNQGVQLTVPFMGAGEEAVGLAMLECTKSNNREIKVAVYLRDVSLTMRQFERTRCSELELIDQKKFHSLVYPARQLYIRGEGPKKRVVSERPEMCIIELQGTQASNVYYQPTWKLSNSALSANISTVNGAFCRIVALSRDGILFRILLNKNGGYLSAEIETDFVLHDEESCLGGGTHQQQGQNMTNQGSKTFTKEVTKETHVSVVIQKRQRQNNLLWTVRINYQSPHCYNGEGMQLKHTMVLDGGIQDDELLFAAGHGLEEIITCLLKSTNVNCRDVRERTPFLLATEGERINVLKTLLEHGAQPESVDNEGQSALHYAAANGHVEIFSLLLAQRKVDFNSKDDHSWSPLACAAANGHNVVVQLLLDQPGIRVDTKDKCQRTPLLHAARQGHTAVFDLLLRAGSDPNTQDQNGMTPLLFAASNGHVDIFKGLLKKTRVNLDFIENSPMRLAANNGHMSIINELSKVRSLSEDDRAKLLELAAENGHGVMVKELLATNQIKINVGITVLHTAAKHGHKDVVNELLTHTRIHPDLNKDKQGSSPLHIAAANGHIGVVHELLATWKVDTNSKNKYQMTALQLAASRGNKWIVWQLLVRKDVDVDYQHKKGISALRLAVQYGYGDIMNMLFATGRSDHTIEDSAGVTPLVAAVRLGHKNLVKGLVELETVSLYHKASTPKQLSSYAARHGHPAVLPELFEAGILDPEFRSDDGWSLVHLATSMNREYSVRILVTKCRCNPNSRDKNGMTPLHLAARRGYMGVVRELLATGEASPLEKDNSSKTAIQLAEDSGDARIVKALKDASNCNNDKGGPCPQKRVEDKHFGTRKDPAEASSVKVDEKMPKKSLLRRILK